MSNNYDSIVITGGTGSLGSTLVSHLLPLPWVRRIIIFSRGELAQVNLRRSLATHPDSSKLRFWIGDIRDPRRLSRALSGIDTVIHCAALKHVDVCELNPIECVQTNVTGSQNLIEAAIDRGVGKVLAISTDKETAPVNLYGAAKLCATKLFIAANAYSPNSTRFSVVRFGNFLNSSGSVLQYWDHLAKSGSASLPITDRNMTRFFIPLPDVCHLIAAILPVMHGGEIFLPKMHSYRLVDLAANLYPTHQLTEVGIREGEKLHEDMVGENECRHVWDCGDWYVVSKDYNHFGKRMPDTFTYSSKEASK